MAGDRGAGEPSEAAWVVALKGREAWAWERLQAVALERVFRYLLLRVGRREDAEDLTAETFAAAVAGIDTYRGEAGVVGWLIGIARRKLADARRHRRRHPELLATDLPEGVAWDALLAAVPDAGALVPVDEIARRDRLLAVRRLVLQLPEPQREALWLRCVDDLSVIEIARVMGRTPDAVKGLLHRARNAVRAALEAEERPSRSLSILRRKSPRLLKERIDAEPLEPLNGRGVPVLEPAPDTPSPSGSGRVARSSRWRRALARILRRPMPHATIAEEPISPETVAVVRAAFPLSQPSRTLEARIAEICRAPRPEPCGQLGEPRPAAHTPRFWRDWTMQRRLSLGLVALAAISLFLVLGRATHPAYALLQRVDAAYRQLRTVHLVGWSLNGEGRRVEHEIWYAKPYRAWARRGDTLEICDGTYEWRYVKGARTADRERVPVLDAEMWQRHFDLASHIAHARRGVGVEDVGTELLEGAPARKIRFTGGRVDERETWWLDPKTNLVRRQVTERRESVESGPWRVVGHKSTRYEYNVTPPAGIFTFTPPPGVTVTTTPAGARGHFAPMLTDGRVLARKKWGETPIELLAFRRSPRGDLYTVVRAGRLGALPLELVNSAGGRYVGRGLHMGGERTEKGYAIVFFPVHPAPPGRRTYELRVSHHGAEGEPWPRLEPGQVVARFSGLTPKEGPASLDILTREFARRDMDVDLEFLRASGLGLTAHREGRIGEALPHLENAARLATNPNREDTHAVYLALADLYRQSGRRDEARAWLEKSYRAANADLGNLGTSRKAMDAMERLGERETARRWVREQLFAPRHPLGPTYLHRLAQQYERLGGDAAETRKVVQRQLERHLRERPGLGSGDAWEMGEFFERAGRADLALESYVKGLETSDMLKQYRASGGKVWREDVERFTAAIRRLGGEEAVKRLTPRDVKW